jgi:hypothetical protein
MSDGLGLNLTPLSVLTFIIDVISTLHNSSIVLLLDELLLKKSA